MGHVVSLTVDAAWVGLPFGWYLICLGPLFTHVFVMACLCLGSALGVMVGLLVSRSAFGFGGTRRCPIALLACKGLGAVWLMPLGGKSLS